ncbi:MAG: hypothetical protein DMG40_04835 [Acidobacteria bacterium]|nr:MAG: hypothetical protein DMG40_04835 [Acidobacteriota bacterium]
MNKIKAALTLWLLLYARSALAQSVEKEPAAVVELGGVGNWNVKGGGSSLGPTVAVEFTPIKRWLELEVGVTPQFARHSTEWETDLLFKKPWDISKKVEFMMGVGPAWVRTNRSGMQRNSISAEIAPDFMFWPSAKRRFGWYIEPGYEFNFARGHEQSTGLTIGLLIAIR